MKIRVTLPPEAAALPSPALPKASDAPEAYLIPAERSEPPVEPRRPKIRVTLAPPPPEPIPAKVMAFWHHDEDAHRASTPWRYAESPNEQVIREQAERDGCWAGL